MAAIGIDLGTTYCCVGVWQLGRVEIISNHEGNRITPSYVAFTERDHLVGEGAKMQLTMDPCNTVFDAKRLIGRRYDDPDVQADMKHWPFKVITDSTKKPHIQVFYRNEATRFYPEQISAMLLTHMKEIAQNFLGDDTPVTQAVITVPAYFSDAQRQSTYQAGKIAGLDVLRILVEPTAAAIAYSLEKRQGDETVLVYDWGGGTFDVSILLLVAGEFQVKATAGNSHLGGQDLDTRLLDHCLREIDLAHGVDLSKDMKAIQRLRQACEDAKRTLSVASQATIYVDGLLRGDDVHLVLSRARFETLCQDCFDETMQHVAAALADADLAVDAIDQVVLMGGSSRIPKVKSMLRTFFHGKELNHMIHPDEAVAHGAAILAAQLGGLDLEKDDGPQAFLLKDATPLSFGIETEGGLMEVVVPRHSPYPLQITRLFRTVIDDQHHIDFQVFEGESALTRENNFLGRFNIDQLPLMDRHKVMFDVTFDIDANGLLTVSAVERRTKKTKKIHISHHTSRFSKADIDRMIDKAQRFASDDKREVERIQAQLRLDDYMYSLKGRKECVGSVRRVQRWLERNRAATKAAFEDKLCELQHAVESGQVI
ncbi:Aste57867_11697 [Aphanomyces stellatus]|uniref:Aste57867_11697 protein n=1 Tax=Aphanomyces stellatus TaxID=120398 RepID=A0A485KTN5_9STRA|nr:hypothetical protein As57867_011654 [Aphanomyces stellatus]VFT88554.1 Aste57867_11697 [Aphanomyces stellatus]